MVTFSLILPAQPVGAFKSAAKPDLTRKAVESPSACCSFVETHPTQPSGLFKALRGVLPKDAAITMDAGTLCLQATDALNYWSPKSLFTPLDFGLVGFSFACGLGVKAARPDRSDSWVCPVCAQAQGPGSSASLYRAP